MSSSSRPFDSTLEDQARRWELLLKVGLDLHAERNVDLLLKKIPHRVTDVIRAERSSLFLLDEDEQELRSKVTEESEEIAVLVGVGIAHLWAARPATKKTNNNWSAVEKPPGQSWRALCGLAL